MCGGCAWDLVWVKDRLRIRNMVIGDPSSKCVKSGTINYMRWEMIPLLDAAGKKLLSEYVGACLICVVFFFGCFLLWIV